MSQYCEENSISHTTFVSTSALKYITTCGEILIKCFITGNLGVLCVCVSLLTLICCLLHAPPNNFALSPVSKCDCYIVLKLPTACACCHRTKTVKNSDTPKWNETFRFRVHSGVKVMKRQFHTVER